MQFGVLIYVQNFGFDWFGGIGFFGIMLGMILLSVCVDLLFNCKLLFDCLLVVLLGVGYVWNCSGYCDQFYYVGVIWYVLLKWIFEVGVNYMVDLLGLVKVFVYYGVVIYGEVGKSVIVLCGGFGCEVYQVIGFGLQIVDFCSYEIIVKWCYWFMCKWGM